MTGQIDTGTDELLATLQAGVLTLTMNRPEARNALTGKMSAALSAQLEDAELNADVRCVVLTGAGKGFALAGTSRVWPRAAMMQKRRVGQRRIPLMKLCIVNV